MYNFTEMFPNYDVSEDGIVYKKWCYFKTV